MAQLNVKEIKKVTKERTSVHTKVKTTYLVFEKGGDRYFQIDTYGKDSRENPGIVSQTIQLDRENAKELAGIIVREFNLEQSELF